MTSARRRCGWSDGTAIPDPLMIDYHDREWGVPVHDDRRLFEFLVLEGMQAGLSWSTILRKRENFRKAFSGFDPAAVSLYTDKEVNRLLADAGIIRNRLKILGTITNARCFLAVKEEFGSFDRYIWQFVDGKPSHHRFKTLKEVPSTTQESDRISKDLKQRGFQFVGPTIIYAHMQATGMVNDHITSCFRYREVQRITRE